MGIGTSLYIILSDYLRISPHKMASHKKNPGEIGERQKRRRVGLKERDVLDSPSSSYFEMDKHMISNSFCNISNPQIVTVN